MAQDQPPVLPGTVSVTFRPFPCGKATWDTLPTSYTLTTNLADAGLSVTVGSIAVHSIRDTAHAIYSSAGGGVPDNKANLQALADQIGLDFWAWRLVAYDRSYNGVVVPAIDGTVDSITWSYREGDCSTRMASTPIGGEVDVMEHDDAASDCDGRLRLYGGTAHATVAGGVLTLPAVKIYVEDGVLKWKIDTPDTVRLCSGS